MKEEQAQLDQEAVCLKAARDVKFYKQNKSSVEARVLCILCVSHVPH